METFQVPSIPTPRSDDPEDVSWALSTAEAMWSRGDHAEAIKWIRRGAEAASEAEADDRALELAKAAADLAGMIVRMSQADTSGDSGRHKAASASAGPPASVAPASMPPASIPPPIPATARSVPPAPGAPRPSASPPAKSVSVVPPAGSPAASSVAVPRATVGGPRPLATARGPERTQSSNKGVLSPKIESKRHKSSARLEEEAKLGQKVDRNARDVMRDAVRDAARDDRRTHTDAAPPTHDEAPASTRGAPDDYSGPETDQHTAKTSEHAAVMHDLESTRVTQQSQQSQQSQQKKKKRSSRTNEMRPRAGSATEEWDAHPTQALSRAELDSITNEHDLPPSHPGAPRPMSAPPAPSQPRRPSAVPVPDTSHVGPIMPSQAVRVVIWQDADGVHVAPAGTIVSAITVDAMLVALDPAADLSAWLDPRHSK